MYLDFYFMYGLFLIAGGGAGVRVASDDDSTFKDYLFPHAVNNPNYLINKPLKQAYASGITAQEYDGISLRQGPMDFMISRGYSWLNFANITQRSGHDLKHLSSAGEYIRDSFAVQMVSGKVLCSWRNPKEVVKTLSIDYVIDILIENNFNAVPIIKNFMHKIMPPPNSYFEEKGSLYEFRVACFLQVLMYYPLLRKFSSTNYAVKYISQVSQIFMNTDATISLYSILGQISNELLSKFKLDNFMAAGIAEESKVFEAVINSRKEISTLVQQNVELKAELVNMSAQVESLAKLISKTLLVNANTFNNSNQLIHMTTMMDVDEKGGEGEGEKEEGLEVESEESNSKKRKMSTGNAFDLMKSATTLSQVSSKGGGFLKLDTKGYYINELMKDDYEYRLTNDNESISTAWSPHQHRRDTKASINTVILFIKKYFMTSAEKLMYNLPPPKADDPQYSLREKEMKELYLTLRKRLFDVINPYAKDFAKENKVSKRYVQK